VIVFHALNFGASRVFATESELVYWLLSRWNQQYVQDTGQLSMPIDNKIEFLRGEGFVGGPLADVYLFNSGSIRNSGWRAGANEHLGALEAGSITISEEGFMALFTELRQRLRVPGSVALWRIAPVVSRIEDALENFVFSVSKHDSMLDLERKAANSAKTFLRNYPDLLWEQDPRQKTFFLLRHR